MNAIQDTILKALAHYRGDDLERAEREFRGKPDGMHGQSGQTRSEILGGCRAHVVKVEAAIAWVKGGAD